MLNYKTFDYVWYKWYDIFSWFCQGDKLLGGVLATTRWQINFLGSLRGSMTRKSSILWYVAYWQSPQWAVPDSHIIKPCFKQFPKRHSPLTRIGRVTGKDHFLSPFAPSLPPRFSPAPGVGQWLRRRPQHSEFDLRSQSSTDEITIFIFVIRIFLPGGALKVRTK